MTSNFGIASSDCTVLCNNKQITVVEGTLLKLTRVDQNNAKIVLMNCIDGSFEIEGTVNVSSIYIIRPQIFYYLMALKECKDRLQVLRNQNQRRLIDLKIGNHITITIVVNKIQERVECKIEYLGPIKELRCGHFIGLVIIQVSKN